MKPIITILAILFATQLSYAQWTTSSGTTTTNDKVGIGNTNPTTNLEILNSSTSQSGDITVHGQGWSSLNLTTHSYPFEQLYLYTNSGGWFSGIRAKNSLRLEVNSYPAIMVAGNRNVGIGNYTTLVEPKANLHVVSPISKTYSSDYWTGQLLSTNETDNPFGVQMLLKGGSSLEGRSFSLQTVDWWIAHGGNLQLQPFAGRVGIGTTNPQSLFQVDDGCTKANIGDASGSTFNYGTSYLGFNAGRNGTNWSISGDGQHNGAGVIYSNIDGNIFFAPIGSAGTADRLLTDADILNKINVKITPDALFAKKIFVQTTGFPDYVFHKSYKLRPLSDVKAYVEKNNHLPEIPSALEVEKTGIDVAEMNKLLLKKVEELTLYLIEKDKNEKQMQKEISELHKQVSVLIKRK